VIFLTCDGSIALLIVTLRFQAAKVKYWFKWFKEAIKTEEKVLLILDGHFSHVPLEVLLSAKEMNIEIFTLPSHTTHFLQPLDVVMFSVFKQSYERALHQFPIDNNGCMPTVRLSTQPWLEAFSIENVKSGFTKLSFECECHARKCYW
jgi:hypothetical protein